MDYLDIWEIVEVDSGIEKSGADLIKRLGRAGIRAKIKAPNFSSLLRNWGAFQKKSNESIKA